MKNAILLIDDVRYDIQILDNLLSSFERVKDLKSDLSFNSTPIGKINVKTSESEIIIKKLNIKKNISIFVDNSELKMFDSYISDLSINNILCINCDFVIFRKNLRKDKMKKLLL